MITHFHHRGWHYLLWFSLAGLVFFLNLGGAALWDVDEGRNMTCFFEMREAGNWIVPTFNGNLRVDKPALLYWLQIISCEIFGVSEFAGRFPSALAALLTVLVTYELARSMFSRTTGFIAGVIVVTTPMLCGAARFANPDALLNLFTVTTLAILWIGHEARRWWWFALLGISTGLAVLAKGPVGLVLPGAVATLFLLWERQLWLVALDWRWVYSLFWFVVTAGPWYLWVAVETKGEFLRGFLWRHNVERGMSAMENHGGFPGFYLVVLLVGAMPWSIFLLASWWYGIWSTIRQPWTRFSGWWTHASEADAATPYRLLACWIVVYLGFFSVAATKLPNYVLPTIVPCAIVIARFLQRWQSGAIMLPRWMLATAPVSLILIGVAFFVGLSIAGGVGELAFLRGRHYPGLGAWAPIGLIPLLAAAVGWWCLQRERYSRFIVALGVTAVLLLAPLAAFGSALFNRFKATRILVGQIDMVGRDHDIRVGGWQVDHLPSLNFYVQRNIDHLHDERDISRFLEYWLPVYLFIPAQEWERLAPNISITARVVGRQYDMYHHVDVVVVTNR